MHEKIVTSVLELLLPVLELLAVESNVALSFVDRVILMVKVVPHDVLIIGLSQVGLIHLGLTFLFHLTLRIHVAIVDVLLLSCFSFFGFTIEHR